LLWQLRAASAISLDDPMAGYEAGQTLLGAGAADSDDPNLQRLLGQLKNKGWLDKQGAEEAKKHVEELKNKPKEISVTYTGEASGSGNARGRDASSNIPFNLQSKLDGDVASLLQVRFPGTNIRINTPSPDEPALKMTINVHDTAWTYHCGLFSCDVSVTSQLMVSVSSPTELRVERTFALEIKRNVSKGGSGFSERLFASSLPNWIGEEVMARFRGVLDEDAVRTSLNNPTRNP